MRPARRRLPERAHDLVVAAASVRGCFWALFLLPCAPRAVRGSEASFDRKIQPRLKPSRSLWISFRPDLAEEGLDLARSCDCALNEREAEARFRELRVAIAAPHVAEHRRQVPGRRRAGTLSEIRRSPHSAVDRMQRPPDV